MTIWKLSSGNNVQSIPLEGGLSLDGGLKPPKLGLLKYIADGYADGAHDVIFVPVAINYDRVLEDRVLIRAHEAGQRRFPASISVVTKFALKQLWLRVSGRFHRFGYAAVSFGAPLSLKEFASAPTGDPTDALGQELMRRIGDVVPVLPVPLIAAVLERGGPMDRAAAELGFSALLTEMNHAHVHLPRNNRDYAVEVGLRHLSERNILTCEDRVYRVAAGQEGALAFYVNSIRHLLPGSPELYIEGDAAEVAETP